MKAYTPTTAQAARREVQRASDQLRDRDRVIAAQSALIELLTDALLGREAQQDRAEVPR